jgi:bacillolysin
MIRRLLSVAVGVMTIIGGQALVAPNAGATSPDRTLPRLSTLTQGAPPSSSTPVTLSHPSVRTAPGRPIARPAEIAKTATPAAAARGYLKRYGAKFHLSDPASQTRVGRVTKTERGHLVRAQQLALGLPVIGGELVVAIDAANNLLSITGETATSAPRSSTPVVSAADAAKNALDRVARAEKVSAGSLRASAPQLSVYDASLVGPGSSVARLVWRMEVGNGFDVRHYTLVDAQRGAVVLDFSMIAEAKELHVCDKANAPSSVYTCPGSGDRSLVGGVDSGPLLPGTDADRALDVNAAFDNSSDFYDFLLAETGRHSVDDADKALRSSVRYCESSGCPFDNAAWTGNEMVYGAGYPRADDVVGHELTHGVTEFTSGLFYYYQSGAINESISDVFGELFDQQVDRAGTDTLETEWLLGEDLPGGAGRNMANPPVAPFYQPDSMTSPLYEADEAFTDHGGVHTNSGVGNKAAFLMSDGGVLNAVTVTGIGPDKTLAVWDAAARLLTSGSDYADLAVALGQGCSSLVGVALVTAADCTQVANAIKAVQMSVDPPAAPTTPAPVCPAGATKSTLWQDGFEDVAPSWVTANWLDQYAPAGWGFTDAYASKGKQALMVDDPITREWSSAIPVSAPNTARRIPVASDGRLTYLRFDHAYDFEAGYDGGKVEYSTDGLNSAPLDAGPRIAAFDHPYNGSIGSDSPIAGEQAFTGWSNGYTSTRVNLSSLAGKQVTPLFTRATDTGGSGLGWFIDNVEVYTCAIATSTTIAQNVSSLTAGGTATISGKLVKAGTTSGIGSRTLRLEQRKKGTSAWGFVVNKTTTSTGAVAVAVKPTANMQYRWRFLGQSSSGLTASTSATKAVLVRPAITRVVNDSTIRLGNTFTVSGRVFPRMDGQSIKLQRYYSGSWHTVKSATLAKYDTTRSKYVLYYKPPVRGTLKFRVYKPADAYHLANAASFTVTVS